MNVDLPDSPVPAIVKLQMSRGGNTIDKSISMTAQNHRRWPLRTKARISTCYPQ